MTYYKTVGGYAISYSYRWLTKGWTPEQQFLIMYDLFILMSTGFKYKKTKEW